MSLGIAFKGPEGIVLAADSRVTLTAEVRQGNVVKTLPSTFDNATKLLEIQGHSYVGAVTYGLGAIGLEEPRTAHSFLPEFEEQLAENLTQEFPEKDEVRLDVKGFAERFSRFFMEQWAERMPGDFQGPPMTFLVGGFDEGEPYGAVFKIEIPSNPDPEEPNPGQFGVTWGGQLEFTTRLIKGFDPRLPFIIQKSLTLTDEQRDRLAEQLVETLSASIPYQFLPLQDCVDLSIFLIRTTMELQTWMIGVRGVGGAIDVATITRTDGFQPVQRKRIVGQRLGA